MSADCFSQFMNWVNFCFLDKNCKTKINGHELEIKHITTWLCLKNQKFLVLKSMDAIYKPKIRGKMKKKLWNWNECFLYKLIAAAVIKI